MKYDIQFTNPFKKDLEKYIDARNPLDHGREGYFYIHKQEVVKQRSLFRFVEFLHTAESHL